ncbi:MarR family winged helix-turn-helix transcriptional regulator [Rhizobium tumorigenes]|uniref:MarR family winged helix-turn-helix transcriptional regulator n=1 Tax=Rhizobium tumorigenes TaxID=2041385 RepID=UPI00241FE880|nr:MarR family transcriptional regulator [Rhizobium tumorigenes]WFS00927.1 MarR family transcriptional regulator [Rhizobium tumorigenes]
MDHVDRILEQWSRERPDLDTAPMGLLGRLGRLHTHLMREVETTLAEHGLTPASFDVMATLRRAGAPYRLSPGELIAATMVTSGTMTNRIDQLEKQGLVARLSNPQDGRSVLIGLTDKGLSVIEDAVTAHVAKQQRITACLSAEEFAALDGLLARYLAHFERAAVE